MKKILIVCFILVFAFIQVVLPAQEVHANILTLVAPLLSVPGVNVVAGCLIAAGLAFATYQAAKAAVNWYYSEQGQQTKSDVLDMVNNTTNGIVNITDNLWTNVKSWVNGKYQSLGTGEQTVNARYGTVEINGFNYLTWTSGAYRNYNSISWVDDTTGRLACGIYGTQYYVTYTMSGNNMIAYDINGNTIGSYNISAGIKPELSIQYYSSSNLYFCVVTYTDTQGIRYNSLKEIATLNANDYVKVINNNVVANVTSNALNLNDDIRNSERIKYLDETQIAGATQNDVVISVEIPEYSNSWEGTFRECVPTGDYVFDGTGTLNPDYTTDGVWIGEWSTTSDGLKVWTGTLTQAGAVVWEGTITDAMSVDVPIDNTGSINWNPIKIAGNLFTTRFPFSLPWDLLRSFTSLADVQGQPDFDMVVPATPYTNSYTLNIDLSMFEDLLQFAKAIELLAFDIGLILITRKLLGGAA